MADPREALVALIEQNGCLPPSDAEDIADAILAAGWTPPGERVKLRAEVDRLRERESALIRAKDADLDDLRDEVEGRDRLVTDIAQEALTAERERDEAQRQVADLRAGIENVQEAIENNRGIDRAWDALNALLSGSGEQPGERDATPDEAHDIGYSKGHADGYREAMAERRPAPMVPDSTDVRYLADRIETAMTDDGHRMPRTDETRYLAHVAAQTALAAVPLIERAAGERVAEGIERLRDALTDDPDRAALELLIEDAARLARGEGS